MMLLKEDFGMARVIRVDESRIDAASAIQFKDRMREMTEGGPDRVVLDLDAVDFIDSSGLGAIVATMKVLAPEKTLELCTMGLTVSKVFRLTRMDQVFTIHDSLSDAVPT